MMAALQSSSSHTQTVCFIFLLGCRCDTTVVRSGTEPRASLLSLTIYSGSSDAIFCHRHDARATKASLRCFSSRHLLASANQPSPPFDHMLNSLFMRPPSASTSRSISLSLTPHSSRVTSINQFANISGGLCR